jgi:hypothetical protein
MNEINSIIVKSLMSVHGSNSIGNKLYCQKKVQCYELFGFDILLDNNLKPYLMEVNVSPALKGSCDMDYRIKTALVVDIFNTVGFKIKDLVSGRTKNRKSASSQSDPTAKRSILHKGNDSLMKLSREDIEILREVEDEVFLF